MRSNIKKRIILIFISIIICLFIDIFVMIVIDENYIDNMKDDVLKYMDIKDIEYINKYEGSYIIVNNKYLYLLNDNYEEIMKIELSLIYENKNNYDIVYKDQTIMYMNDYKNEDGLVFEYYDIYKYELIDKIVIGGN